MLGAGKAMEQTFGDESKKKKLKKSKTDSKRTWAQPVDMHKVDTELFKEWTSKKLHKILPDDDILQEFVLELFFGTETGRPDILAINEHLKSFVGNEESDRFCLEAWLLLLDAQKDPNGIPQTLVEQRKREQEELKEKNARKAADHILLLIRNGQRRTAQHKQTKYLLQKPQIQGKVIKRKTNYNRS